MKRPISIIRNILTEREESVSVAESITAGNIQAALSIPTKALDFFAGGITTYNIDQKVKHLKVTRRHAEKVNCVSRKVASEMAQGAAKLFMSDWSIAITGYAAPVPEKNVSSLFAWVAISYKGRTRTSKRFHLKKMSPLMAQRTFTRMALRLFASCLTN